MGGREKGVCGWRGGKGERESIERGEVQDRSLARCCVVVVSSTRLHGNGIVYEYIRVRIVCSYNRVA